MQSDDALDRLRRYLDTLPPGRVADSAEIASLLTAAWPSLTGSREGGMKAEKLLGRLKEVRWEPPELGFEIERHGGMARGSTRAEIQVWTVNVATASVRGGEIGSRQIRLPQPALRVEPIVDEITGLIINNRRDPRLTWYQDGDVRVLVGGIIPDTAPKKTVAGRRRRFAAALRKRLTVHGWAPVPGRLHRYRRSV
jgi:hypothetical protein